MATTLPPVKLDRRALAEEMHRSFEFVPGKYSGHSRYRRVTLAQCNQTIDVMIGILHQILSRGGRLQIDHFGTFYVHESPQRSGRNPRTGAAIMISAAKTIKFRPSRDFKAPL